ncbi:MAG: VCBS repeat-containing protein, partial [Chloroflexota bacterium]
LIPAGIVQATPLRLQWLSAVLTEYQRLNSGAPLPADGWQIHEQILTEMRTWGARAPVGLCDFLKLTPATCTSLVQSVGKDYTVADAANATIFQEHVRAMRLWMRDNGYRHMPLIVSEFGVLQPSGCGYLGGWDAAVGNQMVKAYMKATFDWLLNTVDTATGWPADGYRLAQRWGWWSLNGEMTNPVTCTPLSVFNGSLYQGAMPGTLTQFGTYWVQYMNGQLGGAPTTLYLPPIMWINNFGVNPSAGGWTSFDRFPRAMGDVNGDGKADIVGFGQYATLVSLSDGAKFGTPRNWITHYGYDPVAGGYTNYGLFPRMLADVNGDGKDDIVAFGMYATLVSLSDGTRFGTPQIWIKHFGSDASAGGYTSFDQFPRTVGDVNGDGKADVVAFGNLATWVSLSTGTSFAWPTNWINHFGSANAAGGWSSYSIRPRWIYDINGDDKGDIVGFGDYAVVAALSTGTKFNAAAVWINNFGNTAKGGGWTTFDQYPRRVADVSGDGLGDVVGFGGAATLVAPSTGSAFGPILTGIAHYGFNASAGGWTSNNTYSRLLGDINGDGTADIIGFGASGTITSLRRW